MLGLVTVVVAILVPITVLNLVLLLAVIRRLRQSETTSAGRPLPASGASIGSFMAVTVDDSVVTDADVADMYVACVMPNCAPCKAQIAELRSKQLVPAERVVFFVFGGPGDESTLELATSLTDLGRVAIADPDGEMAAALGGVDSYPTLLKTAGGRIVAAERSWADLTVAAR